MGARREAGAICGCTVPALCIQTGRSCCMNTRKSMSSSAISRLLNPKLLTMRAIVLSIAILFTAQFLAPDTLRGIRREVLSIFSASNNWWKNRSTPRKPPGTVWGADDTLSLPRWQFPAVHPNHQYVCWKYGH